LTGLLGHGIIGIMGASCSDGAAGARIVPTFILVKKKSGNSAGFSKATPLQGLVAGNALPPNV